MASKTPLLLQAESLQTSGSENLSVTIEPETVANIALTSGSTGRPKIVPFSFLAERRQADLSAITLAPSVGDRVAIVNEAWTNLIVCTLEAGACVYPFNFRRRGATEMVRWLNTQSIDRLPAFAAM